MWCIASEEGKNVFQMPLATHNNCEYMVVK